MSPRGRVRDTYVAALQHDLIELDGTERLIGVVRRPMPWLAAAVDENLPALGPPVALLAEFKDCHAELAETMSDAAAHNAAFEAVDYRERYEEHLESDPDARDALDTLRAALDGGETLVLVCYENTEEKRCHRTILRDRLAQSGSED